MMKVSPDFLKKVALSFLRTFGASLVVFLVGLLAAPEWGFTKAVAVAAIIAAVTAGIRAFQHVLEEGP